MTDKIFDISYKVVDQWVNEWYDFPIQFSLINDLEWLVEQQTNGMDHQRSKCECEVFEVKKRNKLSGDVVHMDTTIWFWK